jgi:hypothetical protein
MNIFIVAVDPHSCQIECSEDRWKYILRKHPEVNGYENYVKEAIENPENGIAYSSNTRTDRRIYYKKIAGKRAEIKVVAQIHSDDFGEIITAHLCSNRPSGEIPIWQT